MIFKNGFNITQYFGARPDYYKQFGLKGHEGLDVIPTNNDWDVYAVEGGTVVRDIDNPRDFGAYGNLVVILNKTNNRAWWYAHNAENSVKLGDEIKAGTKIAKMGATGNAQGAHLHLGLRKADKNGNAINLDNGYQGFINPLPEIESLMQKDGKAVESKVVAKITPSEALPDEFYKIAEFERGKALYGLKVKDAFDKCLEKPNIKVAELDEKVKKLEAKLDLKEQTLNTEIEQKKHYKKSSERLEEELFKANKQIEQLEKVITELRSEVVEEEKQPVEQEPKKEETPLPLDEKEITFYDVLNLFFRYANRKLEQIITK